MKKKTILKILVSIVFLTIILLKIDLDSFIETIPKANPLILLFLTVFLAATFLLNAFNITVLFRSIKEKLPFIVVLSSYISAWLFGKVSTGKSGEISIIYFLKKKGVDISKSVFVTFVDKLISLVVMVLVAFIGCLYFFRDTALVVSLIILAFFLSLVVGFMLQERIFSLIKRYILRGYAKYFAKFSKNLKEVVKKKKRYLAANVLGTVAKMCNSTLVVFVIFWGIDQYVSPWIIFLILGIEGIITQVPISFSGIGVSEGIAIVLFSQAGIPAHLVLFVYLYFRVYNYAMAAVIYMTRPMLKAREQK